MQTLTEALNHLNPISENVYILPIIILILLLLNFIIIHIHSNKKIKHLQNVNSLNEKIIENYKTKNIKHTSREDIELYNSIEKKLIFDCNLEIWSFNLIKKIFLLFFFFDFINK